MVEGDWGAGASIPITDREFQLFRDFLYQHVGISLSPAKKSLLCGRLGRRLVHHGLHSYGDYYRLITGSQAGGELQTAIDLLTTNETHFFREESHFDFLRQEVRARARPDRPFRVWSAACSSGDEPYSIAMLLADELGDGPWEVVASDISTRMLERGRAGLYPIERSRGIPPAYLKAYCLKGIGAHEGSFLISQGLRDRVKFQQVNLNAPLPRLGMFDLVFLRNVMIYFAPETKAKVVGQIAPLLPVGGHLLVGHSESLSGVCEELRLVVPSIYRKAK